MPRAVSGGSRLAAPWGQPLSERMGWLAREGFRVAYLYDGPDYSTFRYRVYNMVDALNRASERVSAAWFFADEWDEVEALAPRLDAIVVCRTRYSYRLDALIERARSRGVDVIYDIDDLIVDADLVPLVVHTLAGSDDERAWDEWYANVGRLRAALLLCDRVLVTTAALARHVGSSTGKDVKVLPNFLNKLQLDVSRPVFESRASSGFAMDLPLHVGYFSGTPSHQKDFEIVSDALARVAEQEKNVRIRTVGYVDARGPLARDHLDRIDHEPLQDFRSLQGLIGRTAVNLIPLQANVFADSKSELKYFEAAAVGTLSIASPTETYAGVIVDGSNGLLARAYDWEDKIMSLVADLLDGRQAYAEMAQQAQRHALDAYSWHGLVADIEAALLEPQGGKRGAQ